MPPTYPDPRIARGMDGSLRVNPQDQIEMPAEASRIDPASRFEPDASTSGIRM